MILMFASAYPFKHPHLPGVRVSLLGNHCSRRNTGKISQNTTRAIYQNNIKFSYFLSLIRLPRAIAPKTNKWMTLIYDVMRLSMIKCRFPRRCEWLKGYSLFGAVRSSYLLQPPSLHPGPRSRFPLSATARQARPGLAYLQQPTAHSYYRAAQCTASPTAYSLLSAGCMVYYYVLWTGCDSRRPTEFSGLVDGLSDMNSEKINRSFNEHTN